MSLKKHHSNVTEQDTLLMTLLYKRFITVRHARMMLGRPPAYPVLNVVKQLRKRGYNIISLTVINNQPKGKHDYIYGVYALCGHRGAV